MMAVNDVYELKHRVRDYNGKPRENVMFYNQSADGVGGPYSTQAERLARDWMLDVWPTIVPTLPATWVTYEVAVRSLFNPADTFVLPLSLPGTRATATDQMPTFTNAVATLAHNNPLVKKGRKAMFGLLEGDQAQGSLVGSGLTTFSNRAAAYLLQVSTIIGGFAFRPCVVKRIPYVTEEGKDAYRLPETIGEKVIGFVVSSVLSLLVRHQGA